MSKERQIIFNSKMVRAILEGRKTQTRRVIDEEFLKPTLKIGSYYDGVGECEMMPCDHSWAGQRINAICSECNKEIIKKCPFGKKGDKLLVEHNEKRFFSPMKTGITLEITNITVERLQDITDSDSVGEGIANGAYAINPINQFKDLWESIKGAGSWEKNPWVWCLTFKVIKND